MMNYSLPNAAHVYAETRQMSSPALSLFNEARARAQRRSWWASLTRRPTALRMLAQAQAAGRNGRHAGRKLVGLDAIRGTEGRAGDFDDQFNPLSDQMRQRWLSVANALEAGVPLPPVQLIQIGAVLYVRDGHHRISVARAHGQTSIEADVTVLNAE